MTLPNPVSIWLTREDILRLLECHERPAGRIEATMSSAVFTKTQARFIDSWVVT